MSLRYQDVCWVTYRCSEVSRQGLVSGEGVYEQVQGTSDEQLSQAGAMGPDTVYPCVRHVSTEVGFCVRRWLLRCAIGAGWLCMIHRGCI